MPEDYSNTTNGIFDLQKEGEVVADIVKEMFTLELSDSQKIVLFELLNKLEEQYTSIDQAEYKLISDLITIFESSLTEPFSSDYSSIVEKAKTDILNR